MRTVRRQVVVPYSGGLSSFGSAVRAIERYGRDGMTLLFADVKQEDADCYRFLVESAEALDVPLEVVADGRDPWDVADDEGFIPNSRVPLCSRVLKHEPCAKWIAENTSDALIVSGIAWHEDHRCEGVSAGYAPLDVVFPMCDPPYLDNTHLAALARSYGVEPPRMYVAGFAHANCAGACFRAGHAAWKHLLRDSPLLFQWHEWREHNWRRTWGRNAAVCRWRSGSQEGAPMTLQTLRRLVEQGQDDQLDLLDWGGCGCTPGDTGKVLIPLSRQAAS